MERKPEYEGGHSSLGLAYKALKRWDDAIRSFKEELKYHPDSFYARLYLGDTYRDMEELSRGADLLQEGPGISLRASP